MSIQKIQDHRSVTIYDIAKEAGVSASTVSRVLTNHANVSKDKKVKIMEIINKYNFKPNAIARSLSDTKSKVIGILAADVRNPYYSELVVSCEQVARELGYTVLVSNFLNQIELEEKLLEKLIEQRVDAIIQLGGRVDDLVSNMEYVEFVNQVMSKTPMIVTGKLEGTKCKMVRIDSRKAIELLMDYLIDLGHKEIAMIGGDLAVLSTYEKFVGYKQKLKEYNLPFDDRLVDVKSSYDIKSGYDSVNKMLDKGARPTAIIAINDFTGAGAMRALVERGIKIPEDITLVSYDNTYMTEMMCPTLTSVDYNYKEFGKKLIEKAIALIEGKEVKELETVSPTLIIRESSRCFN